MATRDRIWLISPWMNKYLPVNDVAAIYDHYHDMKARRVLVEERKYLCYFVQEYYPEIYVRMRTLARLDGAKL